MLIHVSVTIFLRRFLRKNHFHAPIQKFFSSSQKIFSDDFSAAAPELRTFTNYLHSFSPCPHRSFSDFPKISQKNFCPMTLIFLSLSSPPQIFFSRLRKIFRSRSTFSLTFFILLQKNSDFTRKFSPPVSQIGMCIKKFFRAHSKNFLTHKDFFLRSSSPLFSIDFFFLPCYNSTRRLMWWNGRHRGLKIPCREACGFESRHQHDKRMRTDFPHPFLFSAPLPFRTEKRLRSLKGSEAAMRLIQAL